VDNINNTVKSLAALQLDLAASPCEEELTHHEVKPDKKSLRQKNLSRKCRISISAPFKIGDIVVIVNDYKGKKGVKGVVTKSIGEFTHIED